MPEKTLNLYQRLVLAMAEIPTLRKDGQLFIQGRMAKTLTHDAVVEAVRKPLTDYGLVIYPFEIRPVEEQVVITTKNGEYAATKTTLYVTYRVVNSHNPEEFIDVPSIGCGIGNDDKGFGKAFSYAKKTMMVQLFLIASGDDPDHGENPTVKPAKKAAPPKQAEPPKQAPPKLEPTECLKCGTKADRHLKPAAPQDVPEWDIREGERAFWCPTEFCEVWRVVGRINNPTKKKK